MLQIFGSPKTSARRCFWALEELGLPYERKALGLARTECRDRAYLRVNSNGAMPALVDGEFVIWESMAINSYLCEKYGRSLLGQSAEENGSIQQWSFWAISELQKPLMDMLMQMHFVPEGNRDRALCERAQRAAAPMLSVLDEALASKPYLVGGRFTLADLNAASVTAMNLTCGNDLGAFPHLQHWLSACTDRPAFQKTAAMP